MIKKIILFLLVFLGFLLFSFITKIGFDNFNIELSNCSHYENIVLFKGKTTDINKSKVYSLRLFGMDNKFIIYRPLSNYDNLDNSIFEGDRVKIYYQQEANKIDSKIDVIQLEKDGNVLVNKSEYAIKYLVMMITGISACLFMIFLGYKVLNDEDFENPFPPIY